MPELLPHYKQVSKICKNCKKHFSVFPYRKNQCKFCSNSCRFISYKGKRFSPKTEIKKGQRLSPDTEFKGNSNSYEAIHQWVNRKLGKAVMCEFCSIKGAKYAWANKTYSYKRNINDWLSLCTKCHGKYDSGKNWGRAKIIFGDTPRYKYEKKINITKDN